MMSEDERTCRRSQGRKLDSNQAKGRVILQEMDNLNQQMKDQEKDFQRKDEGKQYLKKRRK